MKGNWFFLVVVDFVNVIYKLLCLEILMNFKFFELFWLFSESGIGKLFFFFWTGAFGFLLWIWIWGFGACRLVHLGNQSLNLSVNSGSDFLRWFWFFFFKFYFINWAFIMFWKKKRVWRKSLFLNFYSTKGCCEVLVPRLVLFASIGNLNFSSLWNIEYFIRCTVKRLLFCGRQKLDNF